MDDEQTASSQEPQQTGQAPVEVEPVAPISQPQPAAPMTQPASSTPQPVQQPPAPEMTPPVAVAAPAQAPPPNQELPATQQPIPDQPAPQPVAVAAPATPPVAPAEPAQDTVTEEPEQEPLDEIDEGEKPPSFFRTLLSIIEFFGTVALLVFIILSFGLQSFHVVGTSMSPTLEEGDRLLISKLGRTWGKIMNDPYVPERGDVIVFKSPTDGIELVKRVIGLPGERVVLDSGKLTVYNEDNPEGFNPDEVFPEGEGLEYTAGTVNVVIPEGDIFVTGDNRTPGGSLDSRNSLGTVPVDNIDGKLVLRVLPITEARTF